MTNFGTLIRLRLLVAAPLWLLTLALAPGFAARRSPSVPAPNQSPCRYTGRCLTNTETALDGGAARQPMRSRNAGSDDEPGDPVDHSLVRSREESRSPRRG
jgi:hypothetical protein